MKKLGFTSIILIFISIGSLCQSQTIKGFVFTKSNSKPEPIRNAVVKWINTSIGTLTDSLGSFSLPSQNISNRKLIASYVGFRTDTVEVTSDYIKIFLSSTENFTDEILVESEKKSTFITNDVAKTEVITQSEIKKEACCDLSGCFGRNSSVESSVTDILTDSKELKILGLEGAYTQILVDGIPNFSGLTSKYGISSIPGTLINEIYVSKGSNSVIQGYESIGGTISVLLKDFGSSESLFLNGYMNSYLEKQFNSNFAKKLNNFSTMLSLHTTQKSNPIDNNNDGFLDNTLVTRYFAYNKWSYENDDQTRNVDFAIKYLNEKRVGGQKNFDYSQNLRSNTIYGQTAQINNADFYVRSNFKFKNNELKFYTFGSYYDVLSFYGITRYSGIQKNFYLNSFYDMKLFSNNYLKVGWSYKYEKINEGINFNYPSSKSYAGSYLTTESIPGLFFENSFTGFKNKINIIAGFRTDHHNEFGFVYTPRILLKYEPSSTTVLRFSAGTGFRTVKVFSDFSNILASSKDIIISEHLKPEKTINFGFNVVQSFAVSKISGNVTLDYYVTNFSNKIIPDYETLPNKIIFSNLNGSAHSNVFQIEANVSAYDMLDLKLAYKFIDLHYFKNGIKYYEPFNSRHRILSALTFNPLSKLCNVDVSFQWYGKQKLPPTQSNPILNQRPIESEPYSLVNIQFTRFFKLFELYAGVENVFNFKQDNPIIAPNDPFGPYFDTSFIWGPVKGRELYAGFRIKLQ